MSKKTKRHKQRIERKDRLDHQQLVAQRIIQAREHMLQGDFEGAINICEPLLNILPKQSSLRIEALALFGMSHGMLQHYHQSYDVFTEAVAINPNIADLWYNHGLATLFIGRSGQAVRDFERAIELLGTDKGEVAQKFSKELKKAREQVQETIEMLGEHFTLDLLIEQEEDFQHGIQMTMSSKWKEAEQAFRRVLGRCERLPQYWGNLGVCLLMQLRYDEAEDALKRALEIDPQYALARENLEKLPEVQQAGGPLGITIKNLSQDETLKQSVTFYKDSDGEATGIYRTVEEVGNNIIKSRTPIGKLPPRHRFFLNPYQDTRFTTCPRCGYTSRVRKFHLLILVNPFQPVVMEKICRYCYQCDLIIAHQDQVEEQLAAYFSSVNPDFIGNDYVVAGTLNTARWKSVMHNELPFKEAVEYLHDFKEVITFKLKEK